MSAAPRSASGATSTVRMPLAHAIRVRARRAGAGAEPLPLRFSRPASATDAAGKLLNALSSYLGASSLTLDGESFVSPGSYGAGALWAPHSLPYAQSDPSSVTRFENALTAHVKVGTCEAASWTHQRDAARRAAVPRC
jgi:hypothetical protein